MVSLLFKSVVWSLEVSQAPSQGLEAGEVVPYSKLQLVVIINAAFWLVELLLGYMLQPTSSEKRRLFGGKKIKV